LIIEKIKEWHGHHTEEYCQKDLDIPSCEIYQAIQKGVSDEELIAVAREIDPELFEE